MTKKVYSLFAFLLVASMVLAACAQPTAAPTEAPAEATTAPAAPAAEVSKGSVGIVLPTKNEPRWLQDEARFQSALTAAGYDVEILFSEGDSAKEKANVESLLTKGAKVIILTPQDGAAAAASADAAHAAGAKMIAYDRLILGTKNVDYYVTFDSVAVGEKQGQFLVDNATGTGNALFLYAGAASDNNAFLFFEGAWKVLQPKIADGTFVIKNSSEAVALQDKAELTRDEMAKIIGQVTTNWDFNTAKSLAESNLTATTAADKGKVFILAPNDGTSRAISDAFAADPDVTQYFSTGQDAEKASIQYIIDGKQSMTVLKDVRVLVDDAIKAAIAFLEGGTPEQTTTYNNGAYDVPAKPSEVVTVTKDNVQAAIFDSGYWPTADFDLTNLTAPAATEAPAAAAPFKVGFVTDTGGISDGSFNETQWNGVVEGCKQYGCEAQYIVSNEAGDYEPNLTEFASQGYKLVQAAGFFLGGALAKIAVQYPEVDFTIFDYAYPSAFDVPEGQIGNKECIPNVMGQVFKTDQASFLAGYLAAGMTKTGKIGTFGGAKIPTVTIFMVGYQTGMEYYNQVHGTDVKLVGWDNATGEGNFTGDFQDQVKGKEQTQSLFDEGVDIFMPVGGQIGIPGFEVARENGGYGIWVDTDGYVTLPGVQDVILTSVLKVMDVAAISVIKDVSEGAFKGCTNYVGDLPNSGVGLAPYHDVDSKVPADLKAEVEDLKAKIVSGEFTATGCLAVPDWCPSGLYATP